MTIIAYLPALHKGYLDFFKKYSGGALYILGDRFLKEVPRLDRDIRALAPEDARAAIEPFGIFSRVEVLKEESFGELWGSDKIVMPDEDVSRYFAKTYLNGKNLEFEPVFLRWDKQISEKEFEVPPDRVVSQDALDRELMAVAEEEAKKSRDWWRRVGGALVKNGEAILAAHNKQLPSEYSFGAFGDPRSNFDAGQNIELSKAVHAEAALIAEAARRGFALEGASLYITTFPCPVCAKSVALSGIKRVYYRKGYSLLDAEDVLRANGVQIVLVK